MDKYTREHETEAEKLDRNWNELLQELRVSQTGVQVLTGFLLTLPLQPTFAELSTLERNLYVAAISLSILATGMLVAPVAMHRVLFRKRRKETLVEAGNWVAKVGLVAPGPGQHRRGGVRLQHRLHRDHRPVGGGRHAGRLRARLAGPAAAACAMGTTTDLLPARSGARSVEMVGAQPKGS